MLGCSSSLWGRRDREGQPPCCWEKLVVGVTESPLERPIHLLPREWDWNPGSVGLSLYSAVHRAFRGVCRCCGACWPLRPEAGTDVPGRGCAGAGLTVLSSGLAGSARGPGSLTWD